MKVEIKEVAVVTKDSGEEVLVWDEAFIGTIRSLGVTLPDAPRKTGRHGHPPKPESQIHIRINQEKPTRNNYGTRECAVCHETFSPRSGRAKVCDACRDSRALRRQKAAGGSPSAALAEVRKAADAAGIGGGK